MASFEDEKYSLLQEMIQAVNKIEGIHVDLYQHQYDAVRDALAFLVEGIYQLYHNGIECQSILRQLIQNILLKTSQGGAKEATFVIDKNLKILYQVIIAMKLDEAKQLPKEQRLMEIKKWEIKNKLFFHFNNLNEQRYREGKPANFGGIPRDLLPEWYRMLCFAEIKF